MDKKIIEQLRYQIGDLVCKLEKALSNYYESEYKSSKAEELRLRYLEIAEIKMKEHKEMRDGVQSLKDQIENLSEALIVAKTEIIRLNGELKKEHERYDTFADEFEAYKKEKELKEDSSSREIHNLISQIQVITTKLETPVVKPLKKYETPDDSSKKNTKNDKSMNNSQQTNEHVLKYQLEIVDLKKKIEDDEIHKHKLTEVLRVKKEKNKLYKNDLNKLILLFEECSKEVKWNQDIVLQKNSMIKGLRHKVKKQDDVGKNLMKDLEKLRMGKPTAELGVEVNNDDLTFVNPSPHMFSNNKLII
jgi:chromosome segregation ATPase